MRKLHLLITTYYSQYQENCSSPRKSSLMEILSYEYFPYEMEVHPCENFAPEIFPQENCPLRKSPPGKITPSEIPSPLINHTNERKQIYKICCLEKRHATQHPYQNNQRPL